MAPVLAIVSMVAAYRMLRYGMKYVDQGARKHRHRTRTHGMEDLRAWRRGGTAGP